MDARFDTSKDLRFKKVPQSVRRVKVDKRFAHMFDDKDFVETAAVDSRGQKLHKDSVKSKLREFYELADEKPRDEKSSGSSLRAKPLVSEEATPAEAPARKKKVLRRRKVIEDEAKAMPEPEDEDDDDEGDDEDENAEQKEQESSEEEMDSDSDEEQEEEDGAAWQEEVEVERGDATTRLALMGCDWDHASAGDLLVMLRTYLSSKESRKARSGVIEKVAVYPSQYGVEQTAKEAQSGPEALQNTNFREDEDESKMNEAMRKYQLQRTKYFYAVAFCDSVATAAWLYDNLDGLDADGLCPGMLDLRFVPDDLEFPHAPREEATQAPSKFSGPAMLNSAARHSKVHCTWDEAPATRKRDLMRKKFTQKEAEQMDLDAYLASTSGEDSDGQGAEALKSLVSGADGFSDMDSDSDGDKKEVEGDMEATFSMSASKLEEELTERLEEQREGKDKKGNKIHTLGQKEGKSTWAAYLEKRKEKKKEARAKAKAAKAKRNGDGEDSDKASAAESGDDAGSQGEEEAAGEAELGLLAMDGDEEDNRGFNVRGKLRQGKKRAEKASAKESVGGEFKINVEDPRIARVFASGDFDIDPTNPEYRGSTGMKAVLKKKRDRKLRAPKPAESTPGVATSQTLRPEGAPTPAVSSRPSDASSGGLQLFAKKRPMPAGEGQQAAANSGASQDAPAQGQSAHRKKRKGASV